MNDAQQQVARFERYVEVDPQNALLWVSYGDALHRAGLLDRAEQAFRKSLQLMPDQDVPRARIATIELSRQNFSSAERLLRELLNGGATDPALQFNLALSLYYQRRFSEAAELFEQLASGGMSGATYYLVSCLHNTAQLDRAVEIAHQELNAKPSSKLRGYLALVEMDAGRMDDALDHAKRTLAEQPGNPDAAAVLGTHHLEMQEVDDAQRHLQSLTAVEPRNVRGWQGLALVALYRQQHTDAIDHLERALACDPENTGTLTTLGWVHLTRHDYAAAEKIFREGVDIDRNDAELHGGLASALVMQHRLDEGKEEIKRAFGLDRQCFGAVFAQSVSLKIDGREKLATKLLANMLESSPRAGGRTLLDGLVTFWRNKQAATKPGAGPQS